MEQFEFLQSQLQTVFIDSRRETNPSSIQHNILLLSTYVTTGQLPHIADFNMVKYDELVQASHRSVSLNHSARSEERGQHDSNAQGQPWLSSQHCERPHTRRCSSSVDDFFVSRPQMARLGTLRPSPPNTTSSPFARTNGRWRATVATDKTLKQLHRRQVQSCGKQIVGCAHCGLSATDPLLTVVRPVSRDHDTITYGNLALRIQETKNISASLWAALSNQSIDPRYESDDIDDVAKLCQEHFQTRVGPPPWLEPFIALHRCHQTKITNLQRRTVCTLSARDEVRKRQYQVQRELQLATSLIDSSLHNVRNTAGSSLGNLYSQLSTVGAEIAACEAQTDNARAQAMFYRARLALHLEEIRGYLSVVAAVQRAAVAPYLSHKVVEALAPLATALANGPVAEPKQCTACSLLHSMAPYCPVTGAPHTVTPEPMPPTDGDDDSFDRSASDTNFNSSDVAPPINDPKPSLKPSTVDPACGDAIVTTVSPSEPPSPSPGQGNVDDPLNLTLATTISPPSRDGNTGTPARAKRRFTKRRTFVSIVDESTADGDLPFGAVVHHMCAFMARARCGDLAGMLKMTDQLKGNVASKAFNAVLKSVIKTESRYVEWYRLITGQQLEVSPVPSSVTVPTSTPTSTTRRSVRNGSIRHERRPTTTTRGPDAVVDTSTLRRLVDEIVELDAKSSALRRVLLKREIV